MGFRRSFIAGLVWRVTLLVATIGALDLAMRRDGAVALRIVAIIAVLAAIGAIWSHVQRTNEEVARFVEAIHFGDLSQGFGQAGRGSGFAQLGGVLDTAMRRLRDERHKLAEDCRYHATLVEEVPLALFTVDGSGHVGLISTEARRMFGARDGVDIGSFAEFGSELVHELRDGAAGRRVINLVQGGLVQRAMLSVVHLSRLGAGSRLFAIAPIQHALTEAELAAQSDLVRVLTHEIMNSLTPVTSLARSAAGLMAGIDDGGDEAVGDAHQAVETLARRADALMEFVQNYRRFTRVPEPRRRDFDALAWGGELARLFAAAPYAHSVALTLDVTAGETLHGDPDLLAQAVINLLKNAAEAAAEHANPAVRLSVGKLPGGRMAIAVEDNGAGLAEDTAKDIFLPFFTTKAAGSGVGLSVARQIVVAHHGAIDAGRGDGGGARLRIIL